MDLAASLLDARNRSLALVDDLTDDQLCVPLRETLNPILWEMGHVAWFQERWILQEIHGVENACSETDALYNSIEVSHDTRWDLLLPSRAQTLEYMTCVLNNVLERLEANPSPQAAHLHTLVLFHEDMHVEALTYTRQTLGYAPPPFDAVTPPDGGPLDGDVAIPGGTFQLGAPRDTHRFAFDNEKWAHPVTVPPFQIARAPVTNEAFAAFVDDDGYRRRTLWSDLGWRWRESVGAEHPVYWGREGSGWAVRAFDRWAALAPHRPVSHVSWFEADAYCRWAGRRLPNEAEWEVAASAVPASGGGLADEKRVFPWGDARPDAARANLDGPCLGCGDVGACAAGDSAFGVRQMIGNVWEWTASTFAPFPGFEPDYYKDYSEPWFHSRKVLRGGSWATPSRMIWNTWRNFFTPDRRDVFAGFRTAAPKS